MNWHSIQTKLPSVFAFLGVWQGVLIPSIAEVTEILKLTSASLGVIIGVITLVFKFKAQQKK